MPKKLNLSGSIMGFQSFQKMSWKKFSQISKQEKQHELYKEAKNNKR